jgi:hypothetical protein
LSGIAPEEQEAIKTGLGKLRYDLIPTAGLAEIAKVFTIGAKKYTPWGWLEKPYKVSTAIGAMKRHLEAFQGGEDQDPEGFHHLAAVAFYCLVIMTYQAAGIEDDDRRFDQGGIE